MTALKNRAVWQKLYFWHERPGSFWLVLLMSLLWGNTATIFKVWLLWDEHRKRQVLALLATSADESGWPQLSVHVRELIWTSSLDQPSDDSCSSQHLSAPIGETPSDLHPAGCSDPENCGFLSCYFIPLHFWVIFYATKNIWNFLPCFGFNICFCFFYVPPRCNNLHARKPRQKEIKLLMQSLIAIYICNVYVCV